MVKEIQLTRGYVTLVDDGDYEWLSQWKWYALVDKRRKTVYAFRNEWRDGTKHYRYMHAVIAGTPPGSETDHIDRNGLNNQRDNLRVCTRGQNARNAGRRANNTTGFTGVCWEAGQYVYSARIQCNEKLHRISYHTTRLAAAEAYNAAAREYYGEFACLNEITEDPMRDAEDEARCAANPALLRRRAKPLTDDEASRVYHLAKRLNTTSQANGHAARWAEVLVRRDNDETLQAIADLFGVSRERIRQIEAKARSVLGKGA